MHIHYLTLGNDSWFSRRAYEILDKDEVRLEIFVHKYTQACTFLLVFFKYLSYIRVYVYRIWIPGTEPYNISYNPPDGILQLKVMQVIYPAIACLSLHVACYIAGCTYFKASSDILWCAAIVRPRHIKELVSVILWPLRYATPAEYRLHNTYHDFSRTARLVSQCIDFEIAISTARG